MVAMQSCQALKIPIKTANIRPIKDSSKREFAQWIINNDWSEVIQLSPCEEKFTSFSTSVSAAIDKFFPLKSLRFTSSDKPFITASIKFMIKCRQKAFKSQKWHLYRYWRNKVKRAIHISRQNYYSEKIKPASANSKQWWNEVNRLCGRTKNGTIPEIEVNSECLKGVNLANAINSHFVNITQDYVPLNYDEFIRNLPMSDSLPTVTYNGIVNLLSSLPSAKAGRPDKIPKKL